MQGADDMSPEAFVVVELTCVVARRPGLRFIDQGSLPWLRGTTRLYEHKHLFRPSCFVELIVRG
jgi:hypothetical protein